eukprot:g7316.t1
MQISRSSVRFAVRTPRRLGRPVRLYVSSNAANLQPKKQQLFAEISRLNRGLLASIEDREKIEQLCKELESLNPTPAPLGASSINGQWELLYTTSSSILGGNRPAFLRPQGAIYQFIDAPNLRARNQETWPFYSEVTADLTPVNDSKVNVQFDTFKIFGIVPVKAPPSAKGWLDTTYLDEELRISRGDKGNLFVLVMKDKAAKP